MLACNEAATSGATHGKGLLLVVPLAVRRCHHLRTRGRGAELVKQVRLKLHRHNLEARGLGVELGSLNKCEEERRDALAQALKHALRAAAVEHVGLAVDELHDLARERAVKLLDRPFHVQQHVEPLVDAELHEVEAVV
eukprot:358859-Chlamydomonas_euryale.AAC.9